jgi:hypothetical protein
VVEVVDAAVVDVVELVEWDVVVVAPFTTVVAGAPFAVVVLPLLTVVFEPLLLAPAVVDVTPELEPPTATSKLEDTASPLPVIAFTVYLPSVVPL